MVVVMPETSPQVPKGARKGLAKELAFLLAALGVVVLDQVSKFFIRANQDILPMPEEGFFRISYVTNTGGAFGILGNQAFLIILVTAVGIAAILLYARYPLFNRMLVRVALGLLLGGAVGNLIDRLSYGWVVDFIDIGFGQHRWPAFNLADSAIVVGVILLAYYLIFPARREGATKR
jgi:signal peptidase II